MDYEKVEDLRKVYIFVWNHWLETFSTRVHDVTKTALPW